METYREVCANINPQKTKTQFYLVLLTGIFYLINGFINYYKDGDNIWLGTFWILGGLGLILVAIIKQKTSEKYFVEFNNNGIEFKLSIFSSPNMKWEDIKEINIKPISIIFELKNNTKEELPLGNMRYIQVLEIKAKLKEFADEKGIKTN